MPRQSATPFHRANKSHKQPNSPCTGNQPESTLQGTKARAEEPKQAPQPPLKTKQQNPSRTISRQARARQQPVHTRLHHPVRGPESARPPRALPAHSPAASRRREPPSIAALDG